MSAITTRTFRSGNSEAVRLPKDIGFGAGTEVEIMRQGNTVTIRPVRQSMATMIENLRKLPNDSATWVREPFEPPDREGSEKDWRF